jgi:hypothetical protein
LAEFATVILVGCFPVLPRFWKHICGKDETIRSDDTSRDKKKIRVPNILREDRSLKTSDYHDNLTTEALGSYIELNERDGYRNMPSSPRADFVLDLPSLAPPGTVLRTTDIELVCHS